MSHNNPNVMDYWQARQIPIAGLPISPPGPVINRGNGRDIFCRGLHRAVERREASKYPLPVPPSKQHKANARRAGR